MKNQQIYLKNLQRQQQEERTFSITLDFFFDMYYNVIHKKGLIIMAMITVRVSDEEKEWLSYMAEFFGVTLSDLLKAIQWNN